jgi:hypothetical protein
MGTDRTVLLVVMDAIQVAGADGLVGYVVDCSCLVNDLAEQWL